MFLIDSAHPATTNLEIIADKIIQPLPAPRVSRPRLLDMLEQSMTAGTSTIVCGRAGTGKTVLAVDFANRCGRAVAWYKVDAPDAHPKIFFRYLIGSIRQFIPNFGMKLLMRLLTLLEENRSDDDRIDALADAFVYELAEEDAGPLLIVVEDLHLVSDSEWIVPFFRRLLPLLPSDVHMLITSRNLPPAPLWRMRSKQSLVVIDEEALAFTRPEAASLFESFGLTRDQANIALDHTHGRAAALYEFAEFLEKSETARIGIA